MRRTRNNALSYRNAALLALAVSIVVHLLFLIMYYYGRDAVMPPGRGNHRAPQTLDMTRLFVGFAYNFILVFTLYVINFRLMKAKMAQGPKLAMIIGVTLISTILISYGLNILQGWIFDFLPPPHKRHRWSFFMRGTMMKDIFLGTVVVFSSQLLQLSVRKQQMALENEMLMAENVRTRYETLKNQVDPHFLFNTLNTLNSIIKTDVDKAQEYVQQLSQVLRYTLQNRNVISLEEELKFTRSYCSLMQLRYGDSLRFNFRTDVSYHKYDIIPLSVQTLVENAIKHNVITNRSPLTITIETNRDDTLTVSNPMQLKKEAEAGEGIGLVNLAERYRLMWQKDITIYATDDTFSVTIPLIRPGQADNRI